MPFITIEIDQTIALSLQPFAIEMHVYLSQMLDVPVEKFKTSILRLGETIVGRGESLYARLRIGVLEGRELKLLQTAGRELLERFSKALSDHNPQIPMRVAVEFYQIEPSLLSVKKLP